MVWLEYHRLWRSWVLVYTHLAVTGELNVGLRAPGSANLMGEYPRTGSEPEEMAGLGGAGVAEPWVQKMASRLRHTRAPWTATRVPARAAFWIPQRRRQGTLRAPAQFAQSRSHRAHPTRENRHVL